MRFVMLAMMFLVGCDTPSRAFRDAQVSRVRVGPSVFDVRIQDNRAEAIRINSEWAPGSASVKLRAAAAIEQVSGCEVKRMRGDQAMMVADLSCKGGQVPMPPAEELACEIDGPPLKGLGGELSYSIDCTAL